MKTHLSGVLPAPSRRAALAFTGAALLALIATPVFAAKGGNGKPGGGGEDPPPPNPAPVEYQLTWIDGVSIHDCNTTGNSVGSYNDETGTRKNFWRTADGVINPLDNWWTLPPGYEGWRVGGRFPQMQINEASLVCGTIRNEQTSEEQLFLANLFDPDSLEVFGPVEKEFSVFPWISMNEHGDVTWFSLVGGDFTTLHLYVRSLDEVFSWESGAYNYWPTGINDNLQISLVYYDIYGDHYLSPNFAGSGLLTFDVATQTGEFEDLGGYAESWADPLVMPWGGLNNAGDVFGCFETEVSRIRIRGGSVVTRVADTTAGFIAADSATWTELDARLPVGGTMANRLSYTPAACAHDVNEAGQVLGGYQSSGRFANAEDLWLRDPVDGLFNVDDLVVGDPAEVEAFRAASGFIWPRITEEIIPGTGYGIITGSFSGYSGPGFILTPRLIDQP